MSQSLSEKRTSGSLDNGGQVPPATPTVVGIGASAGGLEAITGLIEAWSNDRGVALILVQRSDPSGESIIAALIASRSKLIHLEAAEGMRMEPGHLYVVPPSCYLSVEAGLLHLSSPPARRGARRPFDHLLHTLSAQYGDRAACVVLSGTGADGTEGLASIKGRGGVVAVQDPSEAAYDGMPASAIATGLVDLVLPVAEIPAALSCYFQRSRESPAVSIERKVDPSGSADNASNADGPFERLSQGERNYRRMEESKTVSYVSHPRPALARPGEVRRQSTLSASVMVSRSVALAELCRRLVMEAYAPASVLVDSTYSMVFSLGPVDTYLRLPAGHATQDLLAMARAGLRVKLCAALQAAQATRGTAIAAGWIAGEGEGQGHPFNIIVHPIVEAGEDLLLVCFPEAAATTSDTASAILSVDPSRLAGLQRELDAARVELRGSVRELELSGEEQRAINEEALSVNEDYQSANEELIASKRGLQSLNEELTAVNSQLQETLERQRTMSDDLQNVLYSTDVATLFLDLDGRIRFFTPAVRALFAIIPGDVGRKFADFKSIDTDPGLAGDLLSVQNGRDPADREFEVTDGKWFRRRTLPYRKNDGGVGGVVITYTDVTARKADRQAVEAAKMGAEAAIAAKTRFLAAASHDLRQPLQTLALLQALLAETVKGEKAKDLVARQEVTLSGITSMLNVLLDINEIEAGVVQPSVSTFTVNDVLERVRTEFTYHALAKGIELRVVPCAEQVCSDEHLLDEVLRNLVSNAVKYTVHGRVLIGCRRQGSTVTLEVWDTGIGMEDASLAKIFESTTRSGIRSG